MKILVAPKDINPYQNSLYGSISNLKVYYIENNKFSFLTWPVYILTSRLKGARILHIHWLYFLKLPRTNAISRFLTGVNIHLFIMLSKLLGYKLVWTVHNVLPHEPYTLDDLNFTRYLASECSAVIAHSNETLKAMKNKYITNKNENIIPIGSYQGLYNDLANRDSARRSLSIGDDHFVILFFGIIRKYKGVEDLLVQFKKINNKNFRLIIVGNCDDPQLLKNIRTLSKDKRITFINKYVPDDEVSLYYNACDVVCLPFRNVTTSSSILLSMSFKKAVISPSIGAIKDIPSDSYLHYNHKDKDAIYKQIVYAGSHNKEISIIANNGYEYSKSLNWDDIANKTRMLFESL